MGEAYPEPDPTLSSDAGHSTYEKAERTEQNDAYPPDGDGVVQTRGAPAEAKPAKTAKTTSSSSSGSSST